jgi:phosphate uptake regulator
MKKDDLLQQSYDEAAGMLQTSEQMYSNVKLALRFKENSDTEIDVYAKDKSINKGERDIRRKILTHLTVVGNESDLNAAFVLITIIHDMERIGDYCKNIYELALKHPQKLAFKTYENEVLTIEAKITECFDLFNQGFQETSSNESREIMIKLSEAKKSVDELLDRFITDTKIDFDNSTMTAFVMYLRFSKRIAAHLHNIATSFVNPFDRIGFGE